MKVALLRYYDGTEHCWYFCPGCQHAHAFSPSVHKWNGDRERPTVTPSLLHSNPQNVGRCHSFITDGMIAFCGDCDHDLKNQTVPLGDIDPSLFDADVVTII